MKYHIETTYGWFDAPEGLKLVLLYLIQGVPFTFDELPVTARENQEIRQVADEHPFWTLEQLYRASAYLLNEECHPLMFELELANPELLPID
jgi:hypothetical protein